MLDYIHYYEIKQISLQWKQMRKKGPVAKKIIKIV